MQSLNNSTWQETIQEIKFMDHYNNKILDLALGAESVFKHYLVVDLTIILDTFSDLKLTPKRW